MTRKIIAKISWGVDILWLLIPLSGWGVFIALQPLPPNDFWWHLKLGELIVKNGQIPQTSLFGLLPDAPFFYGAWLSEVLMYVIYRAGGISLLTLVRTCLALVTLTMVGREAYRRCGSWRVAALAVILAGAMFTNNVPIRPQMWSWVPFVVFLFVLVNYTEGKISRYWLLLCPLLMIFWVNVHGGFVLGLVMLGIVGLGESLGLVLHLPGTHTIDKIKWIMLIGILTAAAILVNPHGWEIFVYVFKLMVDQPSQNLVIEWQSPTPQGVANLTFYFSILALLISWVYTKRKPTLTSVLLTIAFLWLAWTGQRYVVWYGIVVMPILIEAMSDFIPPVWRNVSRRSWMNFLLAVLVFFPLLLVQPWFVEKLPLPDKYWRQVLRGTSMGPFISVETPIAAVEYLKQHPKEHLFHEMGHGSYLIWAMPEQGVFVDPRVELYSLEYWLDYIRISSGIRYEELLDKYAIERVLLSIALQPELMKSLETNVKWKLVYTDQWTQIWDRQ